MLPPVRVSDTLQCHFLEGGWHLVTVAPLPDEPWRSQSRGRDVVQNRLVRQLTLIDAQRKYGAAVYAVSKRRLSKKELKQYPIPTT
jgi:hypothetical protein